MGSAWLEHATSAMSALTEDACACTTRHLFRNRCSEMQSHAPRCARVGVRLGVTPAPAVCAEGMAQTERTRADADLAVSSYTQQRPTVRKTKTAVPLYLALARDAIIRQR